LLDGLRTELSDSEIKKKLDAILKGVDDLRTGVGDLKSGVDDIKTRIDDGFAYLMNLLANKFTKEELKDAIAELNDAQTKEIATEVMTLLAAGFEVQDVMLDEKLQNLYTDLKESKSTEMKLKLGIPLLTVVGSMAGIPVLPLMGTNAGLQLLNFIGTDLHLETKFDIRKWVTEKYKKHELKIYKLMGYIK
jgi:hypothetical protein